GTTPAVGPAREGCPNPETASHPVAQETSDDADVVPVRGATYVRFPPAPPTGHEPPAGNLPAAARIAGGTPGSGDPRLGRRQRPQRQLDDRPELGRQRRPCGGR